jgi:hypothetical protein
LHVVVGAEVGVEGSDGCLLFGCRREDWIGTYGLIPPRSQIVLMEYATIPSAACHERKASRSSSDDARPMRDWQINSEQLAVANSGEWFAALEPAFQRAVLELSRIIVLAAGTLTSISISRRGTEWIDLLVTSNAALTHVTARLPRLSTSISTQSAINIVAQPLVPHFSPICCRFAQGESALERTLVPRQRRCRVLCFEPMSRAASLVWRA